MVGRELRADRVPRIKNKNLSIVHMYLTWYKLCFIAYIQYPTLVTDILVSHFTQITYTYYCTCNMLPNYKDKNKKGTKGKRGQPL